MLTNTQIKTAQSIVNIFETYEVRGNYGNVTVIEGDSGHLTFGRSQTTLSSGGLSKLLEQYCSNSGARFAARLKPYLPMVAARDISLDVDYKFHNILRASSDDPVMRDTQDHFLTRNTGILLNIMPQY
jgi:chitosanase